MTTKYDRISFLASCSLNFLGTVPYYKSADNNNNNNNKMLSTVYIYVHTHRCVIYSDRATNRVSLKLAKRKKERKKERRRPITTKEIKVEGKKKQGFSKAVGSFRVNPPIQSNEPSVVIGVFASLLRNLTSLNSFSPVSKKRVCTQRCPYRVESSKTGKAKRSEGKEKRKTGMGIQRFRLKNQS
jgi:hypothetical protein